MNDIEIGKAFHEKFYSYSEAEIDDMVKVAKELLENLNRQVNGLEKRLKQGNRNARIDEQKRTVPCLSTLGTFIVVEGDDGTFVTQYERIVSLKSQMNVAPQPTSRGNTE